jgi:hemolysin activation/secretion protein
MFHNAHFRRENSRLASSFARTLVIIAATLTCVTSVGAVEQPTLSATVINGASAYTPTQLFTVYSDQLGRPISSASAQAIVAQIEAMYMRDGYSRPEFRLDGDLAAAGILRIEVFEAQVTQVTIGGDPGPYAPRLEQIAAELRGNAPLRSAELQAALQKMRELPGLTIRASTKRDEARRNSYALAIETEFKPIEAVVEISNRGTDEIGPNFVFGQIVSNNLLALEERIGLLFSAATDYEEYHGVGVFFDAPITQSDTHFTTTTFVSRSDPTERFDRDDRYLRERTSVRITQPLDTGVQVKVALSAGIDFDDLEILRSDTRLRNEKLRIAEIGGRISGRIGTANQYLLALQVRHGLDALGSALQANDLLYDQRRDDFLLTRLQFTQLTRINERWSVRLDALGQQSAYVLPDSERYKIGGERLGRGFEVAEIAGDQGVGAKAELRRELTAASAVFGKTALYCFYDFAAAWKQDSPGRESAATSGIGLAIEYGRYGGFVEIAKPLTHADIEGQRDAKVFAELRLKL